MQIKNIMFIAAILLYGCGKKNEDNTGPSFKKYLEQGVDTDLDGNTDKQELYLGEDPLVANLPSFELIANSPLKLSFELFDNTNTKHQQKLTFLDKEQPIADIYNNSIKAIYSKHYKDNDDFPAPKLSDLYSYHLGYVDLPSYYHFIPYQDNKIGKIKVQGSMFLKIKENQNINWISVLESELTVQKSDRSEIKLSAAFQVQDAVYRDMSLPLQIESDISEVEIKDLFVEHNGFNINFNSLKYQHQNKMVQLRDILEVLSKNNATFIFIDGDNRFVKSVAVKGTINELIEKFNLKDSISENLVMGLNHLPTSLNQSSSNWYFYGSENYDGDELLQAKTYILAHISPKDFKDLVPPSSHSKLYFQGTTNINIPNLHPSDTIIIKANFQNKWHIPSDQERIINGKEWSPCANIFGSVFDNGRCLPGFGPGRNTCKERTTNLQREKQNWHPLQRGLLNQFNTRLKVGYDYILPIGYEGDQAVYQLKVDESLLSNETLNLQWPDMVKNSQGDNHIFQVPQKVSYHNLSDKKICDDQPEQILQHGVDASMHVNAEIILNRWTGLE